MLSRLVKLIVVLGFGVYSYGLMEDEKKRKQLSES